MIDQAAQALERFRPHLHGLAYRMLGSMHEPEDVIQGAFLRWQRVNGREIRSPEAWLVTVVTRLALDRLRAIAAERERYVGPWLPEPWLAAASRSRTAASSGTSRPSKPRIKRSC
jgi:RNA polymerase sigma-70 factor (ECF subfamily)